MSLPDKGTKHIPKPQAPIGAKKDGKMKVIDGRTGKESWRQGTKGFLKDFDGDPTATNHNRAGMKNRPQHHARMAVKHRSHKPSMGSRPQHEPGHSGEDSE
jgi:hypothetical protein